MNNALDKYAPFRKIRKYKLKFKTKPWITTSVQNYSSIKNKNLKDFILRRNTYIRKLSFITYINVAETSS